MNAPNTAGWRPEMGEAHSGDDATFTGNRKPFEQLRGLMVQFTPDFEVFPGTRNARATPATTKPFQMVVQPAMTMAD